MTQLEPSRTAIEAAPSAAVVFATMAGYSFSDIAAIFGIIFLVLQMAHLIWRWRRDARREAERLEFAERLGVTRDESDAE